jgi:hypothetical protein
MGSQLQHRPRKIVEYDGFRRRVWILGQRCHHGATGSIVAALAVLGLIAERPSPKSVVAFAAGGALMAHDWKDHAIWFQPGPQEEPHTGGS